MEAKLLFLHALSNLHTGTGQGVGVVDLPIAREKVTGIPLVPGSSVKGVLRDACSADDKTKFKMFGPPTNDPDTYAGAVNFSDLNLLLLPMRSLRGVFAWVTCPLLLRRLKRDAQLAEYDSIPDVVPAIANQNECVVGNLSTAIQHEGKVILEDLVFNAKESEEFKGWLSWLSQHVFPNDVEWQQILQNHTCMVSDDVMSFLMETGTEVAARIAMDDDKKSVRDGALWYEESLPTETVMSGLVISAISKNGLQGAADIFQEVSTILKVPLQIGGNATVGKGICRLYLDD